MYLKDKNVYLSAPIEHDIGKNDWKLEAKKILKEEFGLNVFDPSADINQHWVPVIKEAREKNDYETMTKIAKNFLRKDLCLVDRADFLIAYLPYMVPTVGTCHEIINSVNSKKVTLLICPESKAKIPIWYYGFVPHSCMFGSWEDLYKYLREVDAGLHKDNSRWHYVYGMI